MTGYGRGCASSEGNQITVELSAVNSRKQVEMRFAIPRELGMLEPQLRQQVQQKLSRGSLNIAITYQLSEETNCQLGQLDLAAARRAATALRQAASAAGLSSEPTLADILLVPGVISQNSRLPFEPLQALATQALGQALEALDQMRLTEGAALQADLLARGKIMRNLVEDIAGRGEEAVRQQQQRLQERISKLGLELEINDERLLKEVFFYAERSDITEELVRLQSHLQQYEELLHSADDPGRKLDFLGQEMNREANTLSAKTADSQIAALALALKTELGRVREQIMNIE